MKNPRRTGLLVLLISGGISILWGLTIALKAEAGMMDFQAVYYGTRCLIEHQNPYKASELEAVYQSDGGERPSDSSKHREIVTLYVNLPTTFLFVAPLAVLPWSVAAPIWMLFLVGVFGLAVFLMWQLGARCAPGVALFLICVLLAESELIVAAANTAGVVIGLCVIAVWCFLERRFVVVGVLCMAGALSIKPHDAGLIWLYFLLAGGIHRRRAIQALAVTVVFGALALGWIWHVAPGWTQDWSANMRTIAGPGGANDPGPGSSSGNTASMVIDLQAVLATFRNDPHFYNPATYLVCGALLLVWAVATIQSRSSIERALFGLAAIVPLTILITYHRPYDAKLLLLSVPACAVLWSEGASIRWPAILVTTAGIVMTGEIPLAVLVNLTNGRQLEAVGLLGHLERAVVMRPGSIALMVMAVFYIWVYVQRVFYDKRIEASAVVEGLAVAPGHEPKKFASIYKTLTCGSRLASNRLLA